MSELDLMVLRRMAEVLPDEIVDHEGDCCGSLCDDCGHCMHSLAVCDHDCGGMGHGCRDAIDSDAAVFRRMVLALLDEIDPQEAQNRPLSDERVRDDQPPAPDSGEAASEGAL